MSSSTSQPFPLLSTAHLPHRWILSFWKLLTLCQLPLDLCIGFSLQDLATSLPHSHVQLRLQCRSTPPRLVPSSSSPLDVPALPRADPFVAAQPRAASASSPSTAPAQPRAVSASPTRGSPPGFESLGSPVGPAPAIPTPPPAPFVPAQRVITQMYTRRKRQQAPSPALQPPASFEDP